MSDRLILGHFSILEPIMGKGNGFTSSPIWPVPCVCVGDGSLFLEEGSSLSRIRSVFEREKGKWVLRSWVDEPTVSGVRRDSCCWSRVCLFLVTALSCIVAKTSIARN